MKITSTFHDTHALEARLAARLASGLSARIETLPVDVAERLRFAREQAVSRARDVRRASAAGGTVISVSASGVAALSGFGAWWPRVASALPLLVLVAGFLMIEQWSVREQVLAAAEIDSRLLADDLPPAAYSDPGFAEYLRSAPPP